MAASNNNKGHNTVKRVQAAKSGKKNKNHKFFMAALKEETFGRKQHLDGATEHQEQPPMMTTTTTQQPDTGSVMAAASYADDDVPCIELHFHSSNTKPPAGAAAATTSNASNADSSKADGAAGSANAMKDTLQRAAAPILIMAQCFGVMPVSGIWQADVQRLKFSVCSLPMLFTLVFFCSSSLIMGSQLREVLSVKVNAKSFVGVIFYVNVLLAHLLFISLAIKWPALMRSWSKTEGIFLRSPYTPLKHRLVRRLRFAAVVIVLLSMVEHGLALSSWAFSYVRAVQICETAANVTIGPLTFDGFVRRQNGFLYQVIPFNTPTAVFTLWMNASCTFVWNYMDLFIMVVSRGLAYRFEQINMRIRSLANKADVTESVFTEIRVHYVHVCELLDEVDEHLSSLVLLSCANNLYFICVQLLNIFNKLRWTINYVYFWYSLLYLIGRTAFVFLSAATINDEAKGSVSALRCVPHSVWCVEVERLIFQMSTQTVALSGKKFYFLTRSLLFGMAGTIVTYELVLLQFDEPNRAKGLPALCA